MTNKLFYLRLDESEEFYVYHDFLKFLSTERQQSIERFRFDQDKKLSLFSDLAVRYLACSLLNINNSDLVFSKASYGKPYLVGFPDFHYNISHTRNAVAVGISEKPIGVDIEKVKSFDIGIAKRFFCVNELNYILSEAEKQDKLFYEVWTKKEAFIKWVGKGLSMPLADFDITDMETNQMLYTTVMNDYIISVCSERGFDDLEIAQADQKEAYRWICRLNT